HRRLASTMIYVTHDPVEAMTLGERIAVMKEGAIQQVANPMDLYRQPATMFVAGFMGWPPMNLFRGTLLQRGDGLFFQEQMANGAPSRHRISVRLTDETSAPMRDYIAKSVVLGLRPENIADKLTVPDAPPEQTVEAVSEAVAPMGPD